MAEVVYVANVQPSTIVMSNLHNSNFIKLIILDKKCGTGYGPAHAKVKMKLYWAIPVNKNTPLWRNVDCVRGGCHDQNICPRG